MDRIVPNRINNKIPSYSNYSKYNVNKKNTPTILGNDINLNDMLITNNNRKSPYSIKHTSTVSPAIGNSIRVSNQENSKSQLDFENKILRERLGLKEKELLQKDKVIRDLQDKISKLEIENRNLKRESNSNTNSALNSNNIFLSSSSNNYENLNNQNQRRIGSMIRGNESSNVRSILTDSVRNATNNNNSSNINANSNNRPLRSISTNNQNHLNRINNENINHSNYNRNNTQNRNTDNSLIYQDYGLFPFIAQGANSDIEFPELLLNNTHENNQDFIDPVREVEEMLINELCPNPDQMTYEQLLDFQEKIGYVDKGFTKKDIEKLPKIKYTKSKFKSDEEDKCTVCQYDFKESESIRKLTCGHLYHMECVDEWLLKDKKCPVCKMETRI